MVKRSTTLLIIFISAINSLFAATGYTVSPPIHYNGKNNITLNDLSIDCGNENNIGIFLQNCSNIHITNCKIYNSLTFGIQFYNYQC
jgi:polygalacturonase